MKFADARVTADVVALRKKENDYQLLLIERGHPPFAGMYALPGGFLDDTDATLEDCAARELKEETSIEVSAASLINFGGYGDAGRDPRGRTVTIAFAVILDDGACPKAGDDASALAFFDVRSLPPLAFDHDKIIRDGLRALGVNP